MDTEEHKQKGSQPPTKSPTQVLSPYGPLILVPPSAVASSPRKRKVHQTEIDSSVPMPPAPVPTPPVPEGPSAIGRIRGALLLFGASMSVLFGLGGVQQTGKPPVIVQFQPQSTTNQPILGDAALNQDNLVLNHTGWAWIQRSEESWPRVKKYAIAEPAPGQNTLRSNQYTKESPEWLIITEPLPRIPPSGMPDSSPSSMSPPSPVKTGDDKQGSRVSQILQWGSAAIGGKVLDAIWDSTLKKPVQNYLKKLKAYLRKR